MPTPSSPPSVVTWKTWPWATPSCNPTYALDAQQMWTLRPEFDPQPFPPGRPRRHKHTLFGGLAASGLAHHGHHHASAGAKLSLAQGLIGASAQLHWPQPTPPRRCAASDQRRSNHHPSRLQDPDRAIVEVECVTRNQHGARCKSWCARSWRSRTRSKPWDAPAKKRPGKTGPGLSGNSQLFRQPGSKRLHRRRHGRLRHDGGGSTSTSPPRTHWLPRCAQPALRKPCPPGTGLRPGQCRRPATAGHPGTALYPQPRTAAALPIFGVCPVIATRRA